MATPFHILKLGGQKGGESSPVAEIWTGAVDEWALAALDALRGEAEAILASYSARHWDKSDGGFERLHPRIKMRRGEDAPPGAFGVEWVIRYPARVAGPDQRRQLLSKYVRKGAGDRYCMGVLRRSAKDWQTALIEATEDRLAPIRRQVRTVIDIRRRVMAYAAQEAARRAATSQALDGEDEA